MEFVTINPRLSYHKALLEWCENDPRSLMDMSIHKTRGKHLFKRNKFKLNSKEIQFVKKVGLIKIRDDVSDYIRIRIKHPSPDEKFELDTNHPIHTAKIAKGLCCRVCASECYKIKEWSILSDDQVDKYSMMLMKWIHEQVDP
jgi:hypothetical protein